MSNEQNIASFEDALRIVCEDSKNTVVKELEYFISQGSLSAINKAAELYAESKSREAWDRACEAQRKTCSEITILSFYPSDLTKYIANAPKPEYKP